MAHHNMGGQWRLPRKSEFDELINNCDKVWISEDGVPGYRLTSRANGNSIFLPTTGRAVMDYIQYEDTLCSYWSSGFSNSSEAYILYGSNQYLLTQTEQRRLGLPVRAVM